MRGGKAEVTKKRKKKEIKTQLLVIRLKPEILCEMNGIVQDVQMTSQIQEYGKSEERMPVINCLKHKWDFAYKCEICASQ